MTAAQHEKAYKKVIRHLQNAAEILSTKAKKEDRYYERPKYVKMACGKAYTGVLLAIETYLALLGKPLHKNKKNEELSVDDYCAALPHRNKKIRRAFHDAYCVFCLYGCYDGTTSYPVIKAGMQLANQIAGYIRPAGHAAIKIKI